MKTTLLFCIFLAFIAADPIKFAPNPSWALSWQSQFNESWNNADGVILGSSLGNYSYNFTSGTVNNYRANGQWDNLCGTVFINESTPCSDLVNGQNRYLYFPEKSYCCICCTVSDGCGPLLPTWQSNLNYLGTFELDDVWSTGWYGSDSNTFYYEALNGKPLILARKLNDTAVFDINTYTTTFNQSIFDVPSDCANVTELCPGLCDTNRLFGKKQTFE